MIAFNTNPPNIPDPSTKCKYTYGSSLDILLSPQPVLETSTLLKVTDHSQRQFKNYNYRLIILVLLLGLPFIIFNTRDILERNNIISLQHISVSITKQLLSQFDYSEKTLHPPELLSNDYLYNNLEGDIDFAHYTSGAHIISSHTSQTYKRPSFGIITNILAILELYTEIYPHSVISNPSRHQHPCWLMKGNSGQIAIKLGTNIVIRRIVIQYPREGLVNITTAPREMELWGQPTNEQCTREICNPIFLTRLRYNRFGAHIQQYSVYYPYSISAIKLAIINNWGAERLTCIYKIEIYGIP